MLSFRKKLMSQSRENLRTDGRTDAEILFYRTLPSKTEGRKTELNEDKILKKKQLVIEKLHSYFLKIYWKINFTSKNVHTWNQPTITCSKLTIETLEKGVKYVQQVNNKDNRTSLTLLSLLLTLNIFHTLF